MRDGYKGWVMTDFIERQVPNRSQDWECKGPECIPPPKKISLPIGSKFNALMESVNKQKWIEDMMEKERLAKQIKDTPMRLADDVW